MLFLPLLFLLSPLLSQAASLLAIDYGTDSFKASLIKPGVPFDVLINRDSKRKTPSLVVLRGEERAFGGEAGNLATRFPKDSFPSVKLLLGHPATNPQSQLFTSLYSPPLSTTPRSSPALSTSSASFPVEEILAMQFAYAKEMAEELAGEGVRDCVLTVPAWFGHGERMAVLDGLELAGLRSIALVNDGTAAAVNYAMTRTFPETPSYHLFYDLGAGSLRTTLVSLKSSLLPDLSSLAKNPELKNVTSLEVHGVGFDTGVGGLVFDKIIRDILLEEFEKGGKKVGGDARAMAKLLKEASRVKHVLSANSESMARIEGLIDDIDFKTVVSRMDLEARSADLFPRFTQPIFDALADANLTINDIESVVMIGGTSRVPMVEAAVRNMVGEDRIAKNVNADEAAVMGAALYGAALTKGFRTKDIRVQDTVTYGIDVSYEADLVEGGEEGRRVTTNLFPAGSKTGIKKTLTFKKTSDFALHFAYHKDGLHNDSDQPDNLFETSITGLTTAFTNLTQEAIANATVKVTIELDQSNMVSVVKSVVVLSGEEDAGSPTFNDRFKGLFGKFGSKSSEAEGGAEPVPDLENDTNEQQPFNANDYAEFMPDENDSEEEKNRKIDELVKNMSKPKPAPVVAGLRNATTVRLDAKTVLLERVSMSLEEKTDARKRLREVKAAETRKLAKEQARNELEAYIYKARDLVAESSFIAASLETERKLIGEKTESANEWLWDEADGASTKELKAKRTELEKLIKLVSSRVAEANQRASIVYAFTELLTTATNFLTSAQANTTSALASSQTPKYTQLELDNFSKQLESDRLWFTETSKRQEGLKATDDAVLRVADADRKAKSLESEMGKLFRKKAPRKSKVSSKPKKVVVEEEKKVESKAEEIPVVEESKTEETVGEPEAVVIEEPIVVEEVVLERAKDEL